jgi:hypothetical protein
MTRPGRYSVLPLLLFACAPVKNGGDGDGDGDGGTPDAAGHVLQRIVVTPTNPIVELDLNTSGSQPFTVTAEYADGDDFDITDQVEWAVANPAVGTLTAGTLAIPAFPAVTAETSLITATWRAEYEGQAQITVVAYQRTGPQQDFFFVLPYQDPGGPESKPLDFSTAIPSMDVFFLMDSTASMGGVIGNLKSGLTGTVIPQVQAQVPDTQFGAGDFRDFPIDPFGSTGDQPFVLRQAITASAAAAQAGVNAMGAGGGNDGPESGLEALYQVATGNGLSGPGATSVAVNHAGVGGVQFRATSMPVIVHLTDIITHSKGEANQLCGGNSEYGMDDATVAAAAHTRTQVKTALDAICARVVGVPTVSGAGSACDGRADLTDLATYTGARVPPAAWDVAARPAGCDPTECCTGKAGDGLPVDADGLCPLVFHVESTGTGLGAQIVTGIRMLARFATFDATSERDGGTTDIDGLPLPAPHTTADFITAVTPASSMVPPAPPVITPPTFDATTFFDVTPGTVVSFDVVAFNDFVEPTNQGRIFRAVIRVLAEGCTPLDERDVIILVPPNPVVID